MALQTSGAISLNQIHVEAGGTSGTQASLNDSDIRGLTAAAGKTINSTSGTEIDFADFYGASNAPFSTTTIGITEGDDLYASGLYYGYRSHNSTGLIDNNVTGVTISGKSHTLYAAFRRQNASNYTPVSGSSSFWMYFNNASDGTVAPVDFFDSIDIIFDGNTINLGQSEANSYTSGSGSTGRRDWRWFSSDFTSSELNTFENQIDGYGTFDLRINA